MIKLFSHDVDLKSFVKMFKILDFPFPDGPRSAKISSSFKVKFIFLSTSGSPSLP